MFHFYLNWTILTANLYSRYTRGLENQRIVVQLHACLQNRLTASAAHPLPCSMRTGDFPPE